MGLIAMSERNLQRIGVLSKVVGGRMTTVSAAHVLDLERASGASCRFEYATKRQDFRLKTARVISMTPATN